jgi:hypothetical protein
MEGKSITVGPCFTPLKLLISSAEYAQAWSCCFTRRCSGGAARDCRASRESERPTTPDLGVWQMALLASLLPPLLSATSTTSCHDLFHQCFTTSPLHSPASYITGTSCKRTPYAILPMLGLATTPTKCATSFLGLLHACRQFTDLPEHPSICGKGQGKLTARLSVYIDVEWNTHDEIPFAREQLPVGVHRSLVGDPDTNLTYCIIEEKKALYQHPKNWLLLE